MNNNFHIKLNLIEEDTKSKKVESKKNTIFGEIGNLFNNSTENNSQKVESNNSILDNIGNLFNNSTENDSQKLLMLSIASHLIINSMNKN